MLKAAVWPPSTHHPQAPTGRVQTVAQLDLQNPQSDNDSAEYIWKRSGVARCGDVVRPWAHAHWYANINRVRQPDRADGAIERRRTLALSDTFGCHGVRGAGDDRDASGLNPPPTGLVTHVPLHSDSELYTFIAAGFPRTTMPGWRGQLLDEQMWNLVNYLHTMGRAHP